MPKVEMIILDEVWETKKPYRALARIKGFKKAWKDHREYPTIWRDQPATTYIYNL